MIIDSTILHLGKLGVWGQHWERLEPAMTLTYQVDAHSPDYVGDGWAGIMISHAHRLWLHPYYAIVVMPPTLAKRNVPLFQACALRAPPIVRPRGD